MPPKKKKPKADLSLNEQLIIASKTNKADKIRELLGFKSSEVEQPKAADQKQEEPLVEPQQEHKTTQQRREDETDNFSPSAKKVDVADVNVVDMKGTRNRETYGFTPLHYACYYGKADTAKVLLEYGANVHCKDQKYSCTPLHMLILKNCITDDDRTGGLYSLACMMVEQYGAPVDVCNNEDETPITLLVEKITDWNWNSPNKDSMGRTFRHRMKHLFDLYWNRCNAMMKYSTAGPLVTACSKGYLNAARYLLEVEEREGNVAKAQGMEAEKSVGDDPARTDDVDKDQTVQRQAHRHRHHRDIALERAAEYGHQTVVELLLQNGASVGNSIHYAARKFHGAILELLLGRLVVDTNTDNKEKESMLPQAATTNDEDTVMKEVTKTKIHNDDCNDQVLLKLFCDKDDKGQTLLFATVSTETRSTWGNYVSTQEIAKQQHSKLK